MLVAATGFGPSSAVLVAVQVADLVSVSVAVELAGLKTGLIEMALGLVEVAAAQAQHRR